MEKNINDYKFIISTGCSYGELIRSTFRPFSKINFTENTIEKTFDLYRQYGKNWLNSDGKIITIDLMIGSQGSDWQSDSIIECVQNLLDLGVEPENIYCLVEWSQWSRFTTHPYHYTDMDLSKIIFPNDNQLFFRYYDKSSHFFYDTEFPLKNLYHKIKISQSKNYYYIGKINNRLYLTPGHLSYEDFKENGIEYEHFFNQSKIISNTIPLETKIKSYLNNILRTQYFMKSNNIEYNFYFMQCTLSNWYKNQNSVISHENGNVFNIDNNTIKLNVNWNPVNNYLTDLNIVLPETGNEINKIDFSNFWFYENDKFRFGGVDEYSLDNFKEVGYINLHQYAEEFLDKNGIIPNFGGHPNFVVYLSLWNKITKNCKFFSVKHDFVDFMLNKFWEDYNYDGFSKNNIVMSKKEWIKRMNQ